jgi:hypothetical protein
LRANTDTIALFDVLDVLADLYSLADNLVADNAGWQQLARQSCDRKKKKKKKKKRTIWCWSPATAQHVQV